MCPNACVVGDRNIEIADKLGLQTCTAVVWCALELGMQQKDDPTDDR